MKALEGIKDTFKQFKPTSWDDDNKTTTYIIAITIQLYSPGGQSMMLHGLTHFSTS